MKQGVDSDLLTAALAGYEQQAQEIKAKISDINARLKGKRPVQPSGAVKKHRISAEGRARIAAAQRRRWAAKKKSD